MSRTWVETPTVEWADAIVAAMKLGGVDRLFFVSGSELVFFQEAIARAAARGWPAPQLVTMVHEHVALNAALGDAMVRCQPAATAVHVDVGTLHYGAAVHTAWRGGYPVLMTAGTAPRAFPGSMAGSRFAPVHWVQEPRDQAEVVRQYTKADHRLEHLDNPGLMVSRLLQVAMSAPRGPVYLSIPQETAMLPAPGSMRFPTAGQLGIAGSGWPDPSDVGDIASWLVKAENPVLFTSSAGRDPEAVPALCRLVDLLAVPVMESDHAYALNLPATHWASGTGPAIDEADVVVVLEDVAPFIPGTQDVSDEARVVWVSPDPAQSRLKTFEFTADVWVPASGKGFCDAVYSAAESLLSRADLARIERRRERLRDRHRELAAARAARVERDRSRGELSGQVVAAEIAAIARPDTIVLNDALSNGRFVREYAGRTQPSTYFRGGSSSGGWGSGAAVGAKLARPESDVIHATGDGYFMFGSPLAALWAAEHHRAGYLTVVFVNGSYCTGTTELEKAYPNGYGQQAEHVGGTFGPPPDFAKLAETVGGHGEEVAELESLGPALRRGLEATRENVPAVVAVRVPGPVPVPYRQRPRPGTAARRTAVRRDELSGSSNRQGGREGAE